MNIPHSNEHCTDINKISTDELKQQKFEKWSEGNNSLKNLLNVCSINNVETFACCAGHTNYLGRKTDIPYIAIKISKESFPIVISMINDSINSGLKINLSFNCYHDWVSRLVIYRNSLNKSQINKMFDTISNSIENIYAYENISEIAKSFWQVHRELRDCENPIVHNISYDSLPKTKTLKIDSNTFPFNFPGDFINILGENGFKDMSKGEINRFVLESKHENDIIKAQNGIISALPDIHRNKNKNKSFINSIKHKLKKEDLAMLRKINNPIKTNNKYRLSHEDLRERMFG